MASADDHKMKPDALEKTVICFVIGALTMMAMVNHYASPPEEIKPKIHLASTDAGTNFHEIRIDAERYFARQNTTRAYPCTAWSCNGVDKFECRVEAPLPLVNFPASYMNITKVRTVIETECSGFQPCVLMHKRAMIIWSYFLKRHGDVQAELQDTVAFSYGWPFELLTDELSRTRRSNTMLQISLVMLHSLLDSDWAAASNISIALWQYMFESQVLHARTIAAAIQSPEQWNSTVARYPDLNEPMWSKLMTFII